MSNKKTAVILEAAGDSKRFGSNKLLHIMEDGKAMICSIFDAVRELGIEDVVVVTQYNEIASMADDFTVVINNRPDLGISRSMQLGLSAAGDADGYMFCVCDQPGIKASTLQRLIDAFNNSDAGIVSLSWQGEMCNPKIFAAKYKDELMALRGDTGGRQIVADHTDDLILVEAGSEAETIDIDTPLQ